MRLSILPAVVLLTAAGSALAQMPPPRHYDNGDGSFHPADDASQIDGPGNGLMFELDAFRLSSAFATGGATFTVGTFGTVSGPVTVQPLVQVGYQWDQNALMLGIGVASVGGASGSMGGGTILFGVSPTYRRYMNPLRTSKISPFFEGGLTFNIASPSGGTATWGVGVDVGAGAEWLFVRNFGLFGKALLAYGHGSVAAGGGSATTNLDAVGLEGDVGLTLHL